ncbi:uncharacterized protein HKW66_Vig0227950 [Vigna angularis]|uniref:Uncharacterized protein n=1 Tax=Phaseolus angularis TaxID=3914 RepID=A0A8T0K9T2_PHAAN|nr:uncharacterized protein HKW66_Vig0227950 [Vigna angularis]
MMHQISDPILKESQKRSIKCMHQKSMAAADQIKILSFTAKTLHNHQNVNSFADGLRVKKPNYIFDELDEDLDIFPSKHGNPTENIVKIERSHTLSKTLQCHQVRRDQKSMAAANQIKDFIFHSKNITVSSDRVMLIERVGWQTLLVERADLVTEGKYQNFN